jgi:type II secretory ATPase GspE/PulE/Tfp pilus assembly ATPase PilB-like protein
MLLRALCYFLLMLFNTEENFQRILIDRGLISIGQLAIIQEERKSNLDRLDELYIKLNFIDRKTATNILAEITGFAYIDLEEIYLDSGIYGLLDRDIQKKCLAVVFASSEDALQVAMYDPEDLFLRDAILQAAARYSPQKIDVQFFYASKAAILCVHEKFSDENHHRLCDSMAAFIDRNQVINSVDVILEQAVGFFASDIHFHPEQFTVKIRCRVDGILHTIGTLHKNIWQNFCVRLKILANLDIAESRRPQSGHFESEIGGKKYDFRLSTHPTFFGESIVIRILQKNRDVMTLDQLGFEVDIIEQLQSIIQSPHGLILICGPTGSGKTTTLYTLCSCMDANTQNIMTLEDPIESQLANIQQTDVRQNGILTFADGVRSILRQDPDVIFVGEIRDEDTAKITLRASMTGHLVLSTLHVNDVLHIPSRLYDLGLSPSILSGQLLFLMSQRLVRRVCSACAGKGCSSCKDGFRGRIAIAETLKINAEMESLILSQSSIATLFSTAKGYGFKSMYEDGVSKVKKGLTTMSEIRRVVTE